MLLSSRDLISVTCTVCHNTDIFQIYFVARILSLLDSDASEILLLTAIFVTAVKKELLRRKKSLKMEYYGYVVRSTKVLKRK